MQFTKVLVTKNENDYLSKIFLFCLQKKKRHKITSLLSLFIKPLKCKEKELQWQAITKAFFSLFILLTDQQEKEKGETIGQFDFFVYFSTFYITNAMRVFFLVFFYCLLKRPKNIIWLKIHPEKKKTFTLEKFKHFFNFLPLVFVPFYYLFEVAYSYSLFI